MAKILLVEDEINIASFIERGLKEFGHSVTVCHDGDTGWKILQDEPFDLLILDIIMPKINGLELCRLYRQMFGYQIPVIMLTALGTTEDIVKGLDAGADDYLTKPFSVEELLARLRVTRRRLQMMKSDALNQSAVFVNGDLRIDYAAGCVYLGEEELHLTPIEYKLLCLLAQNAGRVLTHTFIMENIWGSNWEKDIASLRVFMATLRRKLEKNPQSLQYIQTHVGVGYRMMKFEESSENKKGEY